MIDQSGCGTKTLATLTTQMSFVAGMNNLVDSPLLVSCKPFITQFTLIWLYAYNINTSIGFRRHRKPPERNVRQYRNYNIFQHKIRTKDISKFRIKVNVKCTLNYFPFVKDHFIIMPIIIIIFQAMYIALVFNKCLSPFRIQTALEMP